MKKDRFETTDAAAHQPCLEKAQEYRMNPTAAEAALWQHLSQGQLGEHFRRQHPLGGYTPTFVCLTKRLIVEVDGSHPAEEAPSATRAEHWQRLEQEGYRILPFTSEEVLSDTGEVLSEIRAELKRPLLATRHEGAPTGFRVGLGYDVHQLVEGRELWLGGIRLDHARGLLGHSDADVLIHAVCDALLGAANLRDIGYHFPDTSDATLGMDSKLILSQTAALLREQGYEVGNIDATICAQRPKLSPHIPAMQQAMAQAAGIEPGRISVKATTTEHLGFTGREEGIAAYAVALIYGK